MKQLSPVTLRFRLRPLERAYQHQFSASSQRTNRVSLVLALIVFAGFGAIDPWLAPDSIPAVWTIRAVGCGLLVILLAVTYAQRVARFSALLLSAAVLVMAFGILAIMLTVQSESRHNYFAALLPILLFVYGLVRLPFLHAALIGWSIAALYVVLMHGVLATGGHSTVTRALVLAAANLFGMLSGYTRESATRLAFLQRVRLRRQGRQLRHALRHKERVAAALVRSERKYRELVDAMNEGLVTVDAAGLITWVNDSLCRMMGYAQEEIIGHLPTDFLDDAGKRISIEEFGKRVAGVSRRYSIDWLRKDGTRLSTVVSPHAFYSPDGVFTGSTAVISDVTPLKEAEEALSRSERQFRELVDYASSIILRWAADGTIRYINPYGSRLLGYTQEELCGRNVIGTIVPQTESSGRDLREMIREISVRPAKYLYNENENFDRSGRRYWVAWTNRAIRGSDGRVAEILSIGADITELKRAREAIARQRDELAELNAFVRRTFGRYVSDAVVQRLLASPDDLQAGGSQAVVSVLVADIRGFSALCEQLPPTGVVALLNRYLETMTGVIECYDGTIDEIEGDGMLVVFGAPSWTVDHAERAVTCALAMQRAMLEVNAANARDDLPAIEIGIGIHTGDVIVGSIGSAKRAKYGVVGRTVNLAARIEAFTVGGQIMASAETCNAAGLRVLIGRRIQADPKGATRPIELCEIVGIEGHDEMALQPDTTPLVELDEPLSCDYAVLEEKFTGRKIDTGRITALSTTQAKLCCSPPLALFSNIKLLLRDANGGAPAGDLYAKVVRTEAQDCHVLRFTSISAAARRVIADALTPVAVAGQG
jgi:PAS domain S-box-containing protein